MRSSELEHGSTVAAEAVAVVRGSVREVVERADLAVASADGALGPRLGNPMRLVYYRSCAKPLQALCLLRSGAQQRYGLTTSQLAVACGSHSGEAPHLEQVRAILEAVGLDEGALGCGPHLPLHEGTAQAMRCEGEEPAPIHSNCSGKHAGMLASAMALGASPTGYLAPQHPVQRLVATVVEELSGWPAERTSWGVDGCSAPNPAVPLQCVARSYARLVGGGEAERRVVGAMAGNPFLVAGTGRFDTALMETAAGRLVAKGGAAGLHCTADLETGLALAVKLESGNTAAVCQVVVHALAELGWISADERASLEDHAPPVLRDLRGNAVGVVEPLFTLSPLVRV